MENRIGPVMGSQADANRVLLHEKIKAQPVRLGLDF
jgi:hypothetical protein